MTEELDPAAEEYLSEIERAAAALPANRRAELLADVRSHILVAQSESATDVEHPVPVSQILSKLGDPESIVAAAAADLPPRAPAGSPRTDGRSWVKAAVIGLLVVAFLLFAWYLLFWPGEAM